MGLVGFARFVRGTEEAQMPQRQHPGDAGYDLFVSRGALIAPGEWQDVHTDLYVHFPMGIWAQIVGRSSTFRKRGIRVEVGIIDNGYRGELFIACHNMSNEWVRIEPGERIAQLIPHEIIDFVWSETDRLMESDRGDKGFGSTGT